tara:strand:+ start:1482 stop:2522 length:1041 start_codon:yes stop_codon:yes gene_type:complete
MKTLAAVLFEPGKPLELVELEIPKLKEGQVLVKVSVSGVCHTQVLECYGYRGEDKYLPHCLGHEGSGVVQEIGPNVTRVKPGDKVILSWIEGVGANIPRTIYKWNKRDVNAGSITTFSDYSIISENRLTVICEKLTMDEAAMIGCAVPTGVGAVLNTANAQEGKSIAIFGVGGVGLISINTAQFAGCKPIIAVDIMDNKLVLANEMGATHVINSRKTNPVKEISSICPSGVDIAIEASGIPEVMLQALYSVRNYGGIAVIVGNARYGEYIKLDPRQLNNGKQIRGTWGGDSKPERDFFYYMNMISKKKINLKPLLSETYKLTGINLAIDDLRSGKVARPMIDMLRK